MGRHDTGCTLVVMIDPSSVPTLRPARKESDVEKVAETESSCGLGFDLFQSPYYVVSEFRFHDR